VSFLYRVTSTDHEPDPPSASRMFVGKFFLSSPSNHTGLNINLSMIPQLPVELIELCFSAVQDQATQAAIQRTCTLGKRTITPSKLYHTVGYRGSTEDYRTRLLLLVRTLLENPELRDSVIEFRHFFDDHDDVSRNGETESFANYLFSPIAKYRWQPAALSAAVESILLHAYPKEDVESACAILIILFCPKLKILDFGGYLYKLFKLSDVQGLTMDDGSRCQFPSKLSTIEEVRLGEEGGDALRAFNILQLRCLRLDKGNGIQRLHINHLFARGAALTPPLRLRIKQVTVTNCYASCFDIMDIFHLCRDLTYLSVEWASMEDAHHRDDWVTLGRGFFLCRKLESLRLVDCEVFERPDFDEASLRESRRNILPSDRQQTYSARTLPLTHPRLRDLTLTENALWGRDAERWAAEVEKGDFTDMPSESEEDRNAAQGGPSTGHQYRVDDALPRTLSEVLPQFARKLTVVLEDRHVSHEKAEVYFNDPMAPRLEEIVVTNCFGDHWFSKSPHTGGQLVELQLSVAYEGYGRVPR
jgi:hypothetical protein